MAYGHWLLEFLPKLRGFEEYTGTREGEITVFVHSQMTNWQKELLESIGSDVTFERISEEPIFVKKFIMPVGSETRGFCKDDLRWVSESLIEKYSCGTTDGGFSNRVYLSRKNYSRSIKNRDSLMSMLTGYGFEIYQPEKMKIDEQISLFRNANIITGPVGSAFSNMIFCEDTKLLPIHPPNTFHSYFYELAAALGIESIPFRANYDERNQNITEPDKSFTGLGYTSNAYERDFTVSPQRFEDVLNQAFELRS
jgi:capsular polysaccharide biosynthesis protein